MRCFAEPERWSADTIVLEADEAHHLAHVLRAETGQTVTVLDGRGREAQAEVRELGRDSVTLTILQQMLHPEPVPQLTLIQALPREQKMDLILQKSTELGISGIMPVVSDNAVVRLKVGEDEAKLQRWDKIVLNAAKQCGAKWLPKLYPVQNLLDCLKDMPRMDLLITCSLEPDARPLRAVLAEAKQSNPRTIGILVGPEGDFSSREKAAARQAGARPVSLGQLTLRAETATLYALSVLQYEFQDDGK